MVAADSRGAASHRGSVAGAVTTRRCGLIAGGWLRLVACCVFGGGSPCWWCPVRRRLFIQVVFAPRGMDRVWSSGAVCGGTRTPFLECTRTTSVGRREGHGSRHGVLPSFAGACHGVRTKFLKERTFDFLTSHSASGSPCAAGCPLSGNALRMSCRIGPLNAILGLAKTPPGPIDLDVETSVVFEVFKTPDR